MSRVKAIYRSLGPFLEAASRFYAPRHRAEWLGKITEPGVRRRARVLLPTTQCAADGTSGRPGGSSAEGKKHPAWKRFCQIPSIGPTGLPHCLEFCKLRTVSPPSGSYGRTADLASRQKEAPYHRRVDGQLERSEETDLHSRTGTETAIMKVRRSWPPANRGRFRSSTQLC